jgi:hypothetical protein
LQTKFFRCKAVANSHINENQFFQSSLIENVKHNIAHNNSALLLSKQGFVKKFRGLEKKKMSGNVVNPRNFIDISQTGKVRYNNYHGVRIADGYKRTSGYVQIGIWSTTYSLHRLVAWAFLRHQWTPEKNTVDHIDGNPSNNHVSNLEWISQAEQNRRRFERAVLSGKKLSNTTTNSNQVSVKRKDNDEQAESFDSYADAERSLGLTDGTLSRFARGENPQSLADYDIEAVPIDPTLLALTWEPIVILGIATKWKISKTGHVMNSFGKISKGSEDGGNYRVVHIEPFGLIRVHALVVATFFEQKSRPTPSHTINHKDGNRGHNDVSNLEWATYSEQTLHQWAMNKTSGARKQRADSKPIEAAPVGTEDWTRYPGISQCANTLNVKRENIRACLKGQRKTIGGYKYRLVVVPADPQDEWVTLDLTTMVPFQIPNTSAAQTVSSVLVGVGANNDNDDEEEVDQADGNNDDEEEDDEEDGEDDEEDDDAVQGQAKRPCLPKSK